MDILNMSVGFVGQFKRLLNLAARRLSYDIYHSEPILEIFKLPINDGQKVAFLSTIFDKLNNYYNLNLSVKELGYKFNRNFDLQPEELSMDMTKNLDKVFDLILNWKTTGIKNLILKTNVPKWNTQYDYEVLRDEKDKWIFKDADQMRKYQDFPMNKIIGKNQEMKIDEMEEIDKELDELNIEITIKEDPPKFQAATLPQKWIKNVETKKKISEKYIFNIEVFNKSVYPNIKCFKSDKYWNNISQYCQEKKSKYIKIIVLNGQPPPQNVKYHGIFDENPYMKNWNDQVIVLQGKRKLIIAKDAQIDIIYNLLNEKLLPTKMLLFCNWSILYFKSQSNLHYLNENRRNIHTRRTFPKLDFTPIDLD